MTTKESVLQLLDRPWQCVCSSREFLPRKSAVLRCAKCGRVNFEAGIHFRRIYEGLGEVHQAERKYMQRLLRKDWPQCPNCKKRFRSLQKHMDKRHPKVLFPKPDVELFV